MSIPYLGKLNFWQFNIAMFFNGTFIVDLAFLKPVIFRGKLLVTTRAQLPVGPGLSRKGLG